MSRQVREPFWVVLRWCLVIPTEKPEDLSRTIVVQMGQRLQRHATLGHTSQFNRPAS